jgi:uncharacterized protein YxeA
MAIELIIATITLIILIFFIIHKKNNKKIKPQVDIEKKDQKSNTEPKTHHIQKPSERPQIELGKNKWLHTTDNFGKMKKGKVL